MNAGVVTMVIEAVSGLIVAVTGLVAAVAALIHSVRTRQQVQQVVQAQAVQRDQETQQPLRLS